MGRKERSDQQGDHGEAAAWLARLHADDRSPRDDAAFRAWLRESDDNARRFDHASAVWDSVGGLRDTIDRDPPMRVRRAIPRRTVLLGAGSAALAAGSMFAWSAASAQVFRTGVGEQRRLMLDDRSRLLLDTHTEVTVRLGRDRRQLFLNYGQANIDVAEDARPFVLDAGQTAMLSPNGVFDVRRDASRFSMMVLQGQALLTDKTSPRWIKSGHRVSTGERNATKIDEPDMRDATAWQSGRAAFRNTSLAEAVAELNRYSDQALVIEDPNLGGLRLSGVYRVGDNAAFAQAIALLLPVRSAVSAYEIRLQRA